ncbi:MAG TPA: hypothetical protein VF529_09990 [Solirubrobacteraceae bacterium]
MLTHQELIRLCGLRPGEQESDGSQGPVRPCLRRNVRSAGYDLRLGLEYHQETPSIFRAQPRHRVRKLVPGRDEVIVVPPSGAVVVTVYEDFHLPDDMVGHLSLKTNLLMRGFVMANQSQIDAGYDGNIFALFYNLSSEAVALRYLDAILRLELVRLAEETDATYDRERERQTLSQALKAPISSKLEEISARLDRYRGIGYASALALAATLFFGVIQPLLDTTREVGALERDIGQIEERVADFEEHVDAGHGELGRLVATETMLDRLSEDVQELERRVARLRD